MLGSPCSPCCACKPCPYCTPPCLTVTLSGFAHGTGNCGECDFLDDTTFELARGDGAVGISAFISSFVSGSGAQVTATLSHDVATGKYRISSVTLVSPGSGYAPDARFAYSLTRLALSPCPEPCQVEQ